jgi:AraC-like DNA-binding protein/Tfp pilus assembly protein PilF
MKRWLFFIFIFLNCSIYGQEMNVISDFKHLSLEQLFDTANYFYRKNSADTALDLFGLFINQQTTNTDVEHQKKIVEAYTRSAVFHFHKSDFRTANELWVKALLLCEKIGYDTYKPRILNNIGNIYYSFGKYDLAKSYYEKALDLALDQDTLIVIPVPVLNNLGIIELREGRLDNALNLLNKSLQMSMQHDGIFLYNILHGLGELYEQQKNYDSAYVYYRLALDNSIKNEQIKYETKCLSDLGKLFFRHNRVDSALFYIELSNSFAKDHNFLDILAENYLTLSQIEESKGRKIQAFEYFKIYSNLKDSIFNVQKISDINQIQRLYEVSKTNEEIEQLRVEQEVKERTIYFQNIIQRIILTILLLVSTVLVFVFFQKRRLNTAYQTLFEKDVELIENQQNLSEKHREKYKKSALTHDKQGELLDKVLAVMADTSIICNTEFSVEKLAEVVQSNSTYISQAINTVLKKNFRSFLNEYRVREAQRLFSEPDAKKYTIEYVSFTVGFKSQSTFRDAFKEVTGVSPNFYLRSMEKQNS